MRSGRRRPSSRAPRSRRFCSGGSVCRRQLTATFVSHHKFAQNGTLEGQPVGRSRKMVRFSSSLEFDIVVTPSVTLVSARLRSPAAIRADRPQPRLAQSRVRGVAVWRRRATVGPVQVRTTDKGAWAKPSRHAASDVASDRVLCRPRHHLVVQVDRARPKNKAGSKFDPR